jgi:hypothetical protein
LNKNEATIKLQQLKETAERLINSPRGNQDFKKWHRDTEIAIEKIFGEKTRHTKDFTDIKYSLMLFMSGTPESEFNTAYINGLNSAITLFDSFIDEISNYWLDTVEAKSHSDELTAIDKVKLIINRFHKVARQLRSRHASRNTLEIEDEYDVQDLFHALLKLFFDDVRAEECTPSYAGAASRVDFLLKKEKIIVELKKTRQGLSAREVGEQLIIDSQRYQSHPDCNQLICFVYDPEGRIVNPRGIEHDLTKEMNGVEIAVFITPE